MLTQLDRQQQPHTTTRPYTHPHSYPPQRSTTFGPCVSPRAIGLFENVRLNHQRLRQAIDALTHIHTHVCAQVDEHVCHAACTHVYRSKLSSSLSCISTHGFLEGSRSRMRTGQWAGHCGGAHFGAWRPSSLNVQIFNNTHNVLARWKQL